MSDKNNQNFPYKSEKLSDEENKEILSYMKGNTMIYFRLGPAKCLLPNSYVKEAVNIYNLAIRPDDTFIVTFPRSGTTWMQELVWLLKNNLDFETAKSITLNQRFPLLEAFTLRPFPISREQSPSLKESMMATLRPPNIEQMKEFPSPRFIKSHLPLSLLLPTLIHVAKLVYVIRDPRDVAISVFHHLELMQIIAEDIDFKTFWKYFIENKVIWGPYFEHLLEAWAVKNHPNLLILYYEDLLKDLPSNIRRVAKFLNKPLTEEDVASLSDHLKFDNFKKNKAVNMEDFQEVGIFGKNSSFIRQGKSGGWRQYFDEEMKVQADEWMERMLRDTDFKFPHM